MTAAGGIPEAVRTLLREHITDFESLAVLLMLRSDSKTRLTVDALVERVVMPHDSAVAVLHALQSSALLACRFEEGKLTCRYAPGNPQLAAATDLLAQVFEEQRVAVISLMNAYAIERVRSGAMRAFSEAFVVRKKEE